MLAYGAIINARSVSVLEFCMKFFYGTIMALENAPASFSCMLVAIP